MTKQNPLLGSALSVAFAAPAAAQASAGEAWTQLAKADVAAYCRDVRGVHPAMVDPLSPYFAGQVDQACQAAAQRAQGAASYLDWREIMSALVASFRDGHTTIRFTVEPVQARWPGFLIDGQGGGWVVRRPDGLPGAQGAPKDGATLIACDGVAAAAFLKARLDLKTVDWSKAPERIRWAHQAFIDHRLSDPPPVKSCRFSQNGEVIEVSLQWRTVATADLKSALAPFQRRGAPRPVDLRYGEDGHAWIRLGTFQDEPKLAALEARMTADQTRLRTAPYVVLDLRNNLGGNSMWGGRLAAVLWGGEAVETRRLAAQSDDPKDHGKYWRRSKPAAVQTRATADEFAAKGPDYADVAAFWRELSDEIAKSPADGLLKDDCCQPKPRPAAVADLAYKGPVYLLTDAGCFSSGVVVMNTFKRMGAVQVGEPSGQNEVFGESVGPITLPSGLGTYRIPVSIIRQPRKDLGGLAPDIAWPGAMDDDAGLEAWIAHLAKAR